MSGGIRSDPVVEAARPAHPGARWLAWGARLPYGLAALLAAAGAVLLLHDMRFGPWAYSDSVAYIASARNLAAGNGLGIYGPAGNFMPLTLHPPLYPAVLALLIALIDLDPLTTATALNLIAYCGSILLLSGGVYALSRSWVWGISAGGLMLTARTMIANFDGAMTEGPFIFLMLAVLFGLAAFQHTAQRRWWVLAAAAAAAASLTRFAGVAFIAAGAAALLVMGGGVWRARVVRALQFSLAAGLPLALWLGAGALQQGSLASRSVQARADLLGAFNQFRRVLVEQLVLWLPYQTKLPTWRIKSLVVYALIALVLAFGALAVYRVVRARSSLEAHATAQPGAVTVWLLALLFTTAYAGFIGFSYLFSSLPPDLNERMFSPLLPLIFLLCFGAPVLLVQSTRLHPALLAVPLILALLTARVYRPSAAAWLEERHTTGSGYTSLEWRNSELVQAIQALPDELPLISNQAAAVLYYTGRFPYELDDQNEVTPVVQGQLAPVYTEQCAALILFEQHPPLPEWVVETFTTGQQVYHQVQDGGVYFAPGCPLPD